AAGNAIVLGAGAANSGEGAVLHNTTWAVSGSPFENHAIKPARVENNLGIDHPGNRTASSGDFVNAAAGDLRLSAESLALDTASESEVTTDQRGRTRPLGNGPDFGAFESSHSAPSPPDTSMPTETIAQAPNPEDIPTGLGEAGVVEREPSPDDSQTNAAPPQHETDTSQDVETDADGTGTETMTVKDAEGDVALADPSNGEKRTETGLIAPPSTYPPLSYRTVTDGGTPSVAGAIAAGCVVLAGGAGGLAMAFNRRRTAEIEEGDPWQQHEPF
ncbi:MAG: hypothetical protein IH940_07020, partial [Acidobacteria bacterium]|nr:hypothetical protein [Acidobacteriota bacterium]